MAAALLEFGYAQQELGIASVAAFITGGTLQDKNAGSLTGRSALSRNIR